MQDSLGRDETLLALDRAFDSQQIVLLHAYAGSGKTSTATEFARWYHLTGGIDGPVLFTSFEQYKPLAQVLNETIGRVFERALEQAGIHWLALDDEQRRDVSLQILSQIPVLWIWDNIEPIAGFPPGSESKWSNAEQKELADFLRAAQQTKAKFLLTSRRDEQDWLGDLPARVRVPPMPMWERVQLARAIAEKYGRRLTDVNAWIPLLRFTQGNPLTITVVVRQALRDGLKTKAELEAFVAKLRSGEAAFEDEVSEGRDKSLGASLSYGFESAFSDVERKQLALLHFFQGFVDVDVLGVMANHDVFSTAKDRELTRDAGIALLDRAAETGLLEPHGNGYYSIHPALPWFFGSLFDQYYLAQSDSQEESLLNANRAFVEAVSDLGSFYHRHYVEGNQDVITLLSLEEPNLLHARQLSRAHGWWPTMRRWSWLKKLDAKAEKEPESVLMSHFRDAEKFYEEALNLSPQNAVAHLAVTHFQLGNLYADVEIFEGALTHWHNSLRYDETSGNMYGAANTRYNIASALVRTGRLTDAKEYALAALRNYETFGNHAISDIQKAQELLEHIESLLKDN